MAKKSVVKRSQDNTHFVGALIPYIPYIATTVATHLASAGVKAAYNSGIAGKVAKGTYGAAAGAYGTARDSVGGAYHHVRRRVHDATRSAKKPATPKRGTTPKRAATPRRTPRNAFIRGGYTKKRSVKNTDDSESDWEGDGADDEVILPCDTLTNVNEALFIRGTKLKVADITSQMKSQVGASDVANMCRLIVPPSTSYDTLHVARIVRYLINRSVKSVTQIRNELKANISINAARGVRPRTIKTPRTPRTADVTPNDRTLHDNFSELSLLLHLYHFNVTAVQDDNGTLKTKVLFVKPGSTDWLVLFLTQDRHIEILASKNSDSTYGIIFSMKDVVFKRVMDKLQLSMSNRFHLK